MIPVGYLFTLYSHKLNLLSSPVVLVVRTTVEWPGPRHDTLGICASEKVEETRAEIQILGTTALTLKFVSSIAEGRKEKKKLTMSTTWARVVMELTVIVIVSKQ